MHIKKILLPTDLSPEGERAIHAVAELARRNQARVELLHVVEDLAAVPVGEAMARPTAVPGVVQELARARELLEERRRAFPAGVEVSAAVLSAGNIAQAIADQAAQRGCDLIALSTHGRTGFRRLIMGSVAEAILRRARVPVLLFPRQE